MKQHIAKRSDDELKFFTRDLYMRFNSIDEQEANEADEAWETAIREYQAHLASLAKRMPADVERLASLCLHDAELIHQDDLFLTRLSDSGSAGVQVREKDDLWQVYLISYSLFEDVREAAPPANWPYPNPPIQWMYDEVDVSEGRRKRFIHRIMLSDGRVVVVPFTHVDVQVLSIRPASPEGLVAQPA